MRRHIIIYIAVWICAMLQVRAQDSIRVSLLTCSPGHEVHSLYGHTAIRCRDMGGKMDLVFNYGVFDFRQKNFVWRFVLGECDYMVQFMPWEYFLTDYEERGSSVTEQVLNLTNEEARRLTANLLQNCEPENREYRYNFLYNNCTSRVRDMVEDVIDGTVIYKERFPRQTYRQILHQYTAGHQWEQEGIDLLLGADVDTILSDRAAMFAPEYMMQYADSAKIQTEGGYQRPLVRSKEIILPECKDRQQYTSLPYSPLQAALALMGVCLLIMAAEYALGRRSRLWDILLLTAHGTAGTLVLFMLLCSEHPTVDSNWLAVLLNPLPLAMIPAVVREALKHRKTYWWGIYTINLTLFLVFSPWMPQDFGNIVVPLTLALMTRPISYYLYYHKKESKGNSPKEKKKKRK